MVFILNHIMELISYHQNVDYGYVLNCLHELREVIPRRQYNMSRLEPYASEGFVNTMCQQQRVRKFGTGVAGVC